MAYIDSSTRSPLADLADDEDERPRGRAPVSDADLGPAHAEDFLPGEDEDEFADEPAERPAVKEEGETDQAFLTRICDDINIARSLPQEVLDEIGQLVVREYDIDKLSRDDWADKAQNALNFATQKTVPKNYPFAGASNIVFPLISQAAYQFGARTYPAVIANRQVVKGVVWGSDNGTPATEDGTPDSPPKMQPIPNAPPGPDGQPQMQPVWLIAPGEKQKRADRIGGHMSYQLLNEMKGWEGGVDTLLHVMPIVGGAIKKTYFDPVEKKNVSTYVSLLNLVWQYTAESFEAAPRHSEKLMLYPHEIIEQERAGAELDPETGELGEGLFLHLDYGPGGDPIDVEGGDSDDAAPNQSDPDAPHFFVEQHRRYDLDGDGYAEPYIVTVHHRSAKVVRMVARFEADDIKATKDGEILRVDSQDMYTLIPFLPNVEGGSYPMGFGHLLKAINEGVNTTLNQMFDAGHLANAGGGFVSDQLGMPSGQVNFAVGKYVRVNAKGQSIRDAVFPLPFPGPNSVLFQLLGVLMAAGKEMAGIQDILAGDAAIANAPPTTVLALIEQGLKFYTAIIKRVFRGFGQEFEKLYALNRRHLKEITEYQQGEDWQQIGPDDYRLGGGVMPAADPTMVTDMQRLVRGQMLLEFKGDPLINQVEIRRRYFQAANFERVDDLFVPPDPMQQQLVQAKTQYELDNMQAQLGRTRAAELKDQTQALLNMAQARSLAAEPELEFFEKQLTVLRLNIEALNTTVKAADVDAKHHSNRLKETENAARDAAARAASAATGPVPAGVGAVAPPPVHPSVPALPGGPTAVLPPGGGGLG